MKYKLSNLASKTLIEDFTHMKLKYKSIYKPKRKIDGLKEQSINIITIESPNEITQGIWGVLPQLYNESWYKFQRLKSTLHVSNDEINNNILFKEALLKRRCLVLVTGFYTHQLLENKVESFLVEKHDRRPFYLAGIYNLTGDGFYTCAIINVKANDQLNTINNLYETMPLQIPKVFKKIWLDRGTSSDEIKYLISKPYTTKFNIQKIAS